MLNISFNEATRTFHLSNIHISYIMQVEQHNILTHTYFGRKVSGYHQIAQYPEISREFEVNFAENREGDRAYSIGTQLLEFPVYGTGDFRQTACLIRHEDGTTVSDFRYVGHEIIEGTQELSQLPSVYVEDVTEAKTLIIELRDELVQLTLKLRYTIFENHPVIVRSASIENSGTQTSFIEKIASMSLDFPERQFDLIQLNGAWGRERMLERERVRTGIKLLDSKRGTSSHHQTPFIALCDSDTTEFFGEIFGAQLIYSGSHEMSVERDPFGQVRMLLGIQSTGFRWQLQPGEQFEAPEVMIAFSDKGLNGLSQANHTFIKQHIIPRRYANLERPVLINNWEGTYFDFTEQKLHAIIDEASQLGLELFVLDDGWFGTRNDDNSSLGDWHINYDKLPKGLNGLANYTHSKQMKFGLWVEPEMISQNSHLFRQHSDWAIQAPHRPLSLGRGQCVIDMSRQEVRDNIFGQLCAILDTVEIDYIKWDMNRHLSEAHSLALSAEQQGELPHRFVLGVYDLMKRITTRYPNILFESCSGGGGRFDLGILRYMPQTWTSDNTDAIARLFIQYGSSLAFPINSMAAHVSATPNHQTHRHTSLAMRAAVAFAGVFGYEMDLTELSQADKEIISRQVEYYKQHRQLIQSGIFTRLISPFGDSNECAWQFSNRDKTEHLVMYYQVLSHASYPAKKFRLRNLCANTVYRVTSEEQSFIARGDELMHIGFYIYPQFKGDFQARVYHVEAMKE